MYIEFDVTAVIVSYKETKLIRQLITASSEV